MHTRLTAALLAATLLAGCPTSPKGPPSTPPPPARLALVIGNTAYEGAPVLKNPVNDAADMCTALRRLAFEVMCHNDVRDRAAFESLESRA